MITADEGCSIYYTWDGTDPTDTSARYTEPIEVPEGNNILSIIVVNDKTKLTSEILRLRRVAICDILLIRRSAILAELFYVMETKFPIT